MTGVFIFCTRGSSLNKGYGEQCIRMLFSEESVELPSSSRSFIFWLRGRRSSTAGRAMLQWLDIKGTRPRDIVPADRVIIRPIIEKCSPPLGG